MLPQLGELLAHGSVSKAAPFMAACVAITQISAGLVAITQPEDERLVTKREAASPLPESVVVRVKTWASKPAQNVFVQTSNMHTALTSRDGIVWEGMVNLATVPDGTHALKAVALNEEGRNFTSSIHLRVGSFPERRFAEMDQENAIGEWTERGLMGTRLGPNKNGKKW